MKCSLKEFARMANSGQIVGDENVEFTNVAIDSRKVVPGTLFFCIRAGRDGHEFIQSAADAGAVAAVVDHQIDDAPIPQVVVRNTRDALLRSAGEWRKKFNIPVAAVAGSNGKTTTTQLLRAALLQWYRPDQVVTTEGNLNNDLGVPMMLWRLTPEARVAVFEIGMNHVGEMEPLVKAAAPCLSVLTNAQRDHVEFLGELEETARENGEVFRQLPPRGTAVININDDFAPLWMELAHGRKIVTFGGEGADFNLIREGDKVALAFHKNRIAFNFPLPGRHNLLNGAAAAAAAYSLGVSLESIAAGFEGFQPAAHRTAVYKLANGVTLIDDSYNANPDSMRAAIDMLAETGEGRKIFVMGDMLELGDRTDLYHEEIGGYAKEKGIDEMIAYGDLSSCAAEAFGHHAVCARSLEETERKLRELLKDDAKCTVLFKASNSMKLYTLAEALVRENKTEETA